MPGGWTHSTGHHRTTTTAWRHTRARILTRDHHTCTTPGCGLPATDVDHILPVWAHGQDDSDANLTSLCAEHHRTKTSREGNEARKAKGMTQRRPDEPHPGLA